MLGVTLLVVNGWGGTQQQMRGRLNQLNVTGSDRATAEVCDDAWALNCLEIWNDANQDMMATDENDCGITADGLELQCTGRTCWFSIRFNVYEDPVECDCGCERQKSLTGSAMLGPLVLGGIVCTGLLVVFVLVARATWRVWRGASPQGRPAVAGSPSPPLRVVAEEV